MQSGPGGAILLWHVDDIEAVFKRLIAMGATEYDPITKRGDFGFVTASVVDPFGNVLGIMNNPHYVELHSSHEQSQSRYDAKYLNCRASRAMIPTSRYFGPNFLGNFLTEICVCNR